MSDVLNALQCLLDNGLPEKAIVPIANDLLAGDALEDDVDYRCLVLFAHRAEWESDVDCSVEVCKYDDCTFIAGGNEYLVLDEDEKESRWDDCLECYLDDEGIVPGADSPYFDREKWKRDARIDGAGHVLSGYDGAENEFCCPDGGRGWFFIFRTN
jgi:hypothetical protein